MYAEKRHESHHSVNAPEWATHVAICPDQELSADNGIPGWNTWWFINQERKLWSHYNSPVLFSSHFTGFERGDVVIIPLNITLENK
ncbi:hypothetical protein vBKpnPKlyazma_orf055 [Klebsiella phage vB_KpnP_Klyazma]|nr:hypothetical protein vBKpnPKlyazma_orf055 [Klebsiella phage vB_KpnP_Klyazma]